MQIDLTTIQDDIGGDWWLHHRAKDFGFLDKINDKSTHDVEVDDILIHKKILEGERFPAIRYHVVTAGGGTRPATNPEAKEVMAGSLVAFVKANNRLPFACTFAKVFKNGAAQVDYAPTTWDKFAIKVEPAAHGIGDARAFFQHESVPSNPAIPGSGTAGGGKAATPATPATPAPRPQGKVARVTSEPAIVAIATATGGAVSIFDAEVTSIEQRESHYQDEVTTYYLVGLRGGEAAPDAKKSTQHEPFAEIRARLSDTIVNETKLAPGDRITFNGRLKDDKYFGLLLQNVKKVTK
ncbi:MAG: hypothetical protein JW839_06060 [Candidatus Lokiarchaeota archaeon]|nr:hypothetical protein [Candidatus Lokiarchaeota archaeon]